MTLNGRTSSSAIHGFAALERDEAGLVEEQLAEADVAPLRVAREEALELLGPARARLAVALAEHQHGRGRGEEVGEFVPSSCSSLLMGLLTRNGRRGRLRSRAALTLAQAANLSPFFQSAPQRPPLWSACTVRSVSLRAPARGEIVHGDRADDALVVDDDGRAVRDALVLLQHAERARHGVVGVGDDRVRDLLREVLRSANQALWLKNESVDDADHTDAVVGELLRAATWKPLISVGQTKVKSSGYQ